LHAKQQELPSLDTTRAPGADAIAKYEELLSDVLDFKTAVRESRALLGQLEVEVGEQAEQLLDLFDTELRQQFASKQAIDNAFFEKIEALDTSMTQAMVESAEGIMADILGGKPPAGASEEQLQTMSDREAFVGSIKESNGHRLTQLNALWDMCRQKHAALFKGHMDAAVAAATRRSRRFLQQCDTIRDSLLAQVDDLREELEADVAGAKERRSSVAATRHRE